MAEVDHSPIIVITTLNDEGLPVVKDFSGEWLPLSPDGMWDVLHVWSDRTLILVFRSDTDGSPVADVVSPVISDKWMESFMILWGRPVFSPSEGGQARVVTVDPKYSKSLLPVEVLNGSWDTYDFDAYFPGLIRVPQMDEMDESRLLIRYPAVELRDIEGAVIIDDPDEEFLEFFASWSERTVDQRQFLVFDRSDKN